MSRILVVEDDDDILRLVAHRVVAAGHRVIGAADAQAALAVVSERGMPDVAVLDVGLPGQSGLELARTLRARPDGGALGIVFLSGFVQPEDIRRGEELGAAYLTKPFVASALLTAIERQTLQPVASW